MTDTEGHCSTLILTSLGAIHPAEFCFESFNFFKCVEQSSSTWKCVAKAEGGTVLLSQVSDQLSVWVCSRGSQCSGPKDGSTLSCDWLKEKVLT